jgi:thioredoxin 2
VVVYKLRELHDPTMLRLQRQQSASKHLSDTGRCGSCKATLPPISEPIEVNAMEFAQITREAKVPVLVDF